VPRKMSGRKKGGLLDSARLGMECTITLATTAGKWVNSQMSSKRAQAKGMRVSLPVARDSQRRIVGEHVDASAAKPATAPTT